MPPYEPVDLYAAGSLLTDEERMVAETIRSFVEAEVVPIIREHFRAGTFPLRLVPGLARLGVLGANLRAEGCAGMGDVAYGLINQELERGDSAVRSFVSVQTSLVMYPIVTFGSPEQRERWIPELAAGRRIGCYGLTEPDHGSDPGGMITRARRTDRGWILRGAKMWITNATLADVALVWAKDDEGRVRGFLVERGTPGFTQRETKNKWSLRASDTGELVFDDCEIPSQAELPNTDGLKSPLSCLNQARYGIAWGATGAAMACYDEARKYAAARTQFGRPIAAFQLVQQKLTKMLTEITKSQLLNLQLGRLKESGRARHTHISLAKRNNVWQALKIARMARDILGASGITDEYQAGRHMLNLESVHTYEGTHDIHTLIIGAAITGHEAFR
jgi:glutaryl-CoA dehydrogenase